MSQTPTSAAGGDVLSPLSVIVFPGGFNLPIWAAQEQGFFARNGVAVTSTPTPNSVVQLTGLIAGTFDIAMTALDNVVAYDEGQGEAVTAAAPDLIAFMGGDHGFLRLVAVPEVKTFADLKGRRLSVDALTTGYAFVLRNLLEKGGLKDGDYELAKAGGVRERFDALMRGEHAATLLVSPLELIAESRGFTRLADAVDHLGAYQGLVGATRRDFAATHARELVGYVRAYLAGLDWLFDPANRSAAVALLTCHVPAMSAELAARACDVLLDARSGFSRHAEIDPEGVRTVLALRSAYGAPPKRLDDPAKYLDPTFYRAARTGVPV
jgi:ABC-type nitrate/sulfonate/bicarbonate transport system substrate-binding protein